MQLVDEAFARLEAVLRHHDGNGGTKIFHVTGACKERLEQTQAILRLLIQNLARSFTCFGDGPRWRAECVGSLFTAPPCREAV